MPETKISSIVVGVDGSTTSRQAVTWASQLAAQMSVPLDVLAAYGAPLTLEIFTGFSLRYSQQVHDIARTNLDEGLEVARAAAPDVAVGERFVDRPPARALLEAGATDRLLVVGRHGANSRRLGNIGSVTDQIVTHAPGPVVVIPPEDVAPLAGQRIVIGVDASPHSVDALWFGFAVARAVSSKITVVHSWGFDYIWMGSPIPIEDADIQNLRERSEQAIHAVVDPVAAHYPEVEVDWVLERDTPTQSLRDAAASAGLLVLGRRGHGGFQTLLLGSTSKAMTHSAPCPVAVVQS